MNTPTPNVPLLREIAEWIRYQVELGTSPSEREFNNTRNPDVPLWNQSEWAYELNPSDEHCGTACCVAGYAALAQPEVDIKKSLSSDQVIFKDKNREPVSFPEYGQDVLGITFEQAETIFYASGRMPEYIIGLLSEAAGEEL